MSCTYREKVERDLCEFDQLLFFSFYISINLNYLYQKCDQMFDTNTVLTHLRITVSKT